MFVLFYYLFYNFGPKTFKPCCLHSTSKHLQRNFQFSILKIKISCRFKESDCPVQHVFYSWERMKWQDRSIGTPTKFQSRREPHRCLDDLVEGGPSGHATGFSLPANFTNFFTDRYSSDHGATHKSRSERRAGGWEDVRVRHVLRTLDHVLRG